MTNTKNQKLRQAANAGRKMNMWGYIAKLADRLCNYAISKQEDYSEEQHDLIGEIMAEELLGTMAR